MNCLSGPTDACALAGFVLSEPTNRVPYIRICRNLDDPFLFATENKTVAAGESAFDLKFPPFLVILGRN